MIRSSVSPPSRRYVPDRSGFVAVRMTRSPDAPALHRLGERDGRVALPRRLAELDPGAAQRRAVKVHPPAAADDRRPGVLVDAVAIDQPDQRRAIRVDRPLRRADLQRRPRPARRRVRQMGVAVEAVLAGIVARLDLDQPDIEPRVLVAGERQRPRHVNQADRLRPTSRRRRRCALREPAPARRAREPCRPPTSPPRTTARSSPSESNPPAARLCHADVQPHSAARPAAEPRPAQAKRYCDYARSDSSAAFDGDSRLLYGKTSRSSI